MSSTKRFQIFVSSTHTDLKEEREAVINELTKVGYIAVGMEQFPATDEEQMEHIRPIIDESDYYIVIIRGRYGSLSSDGMSYTEKEFRYSQENKTPAMAFLYNNVAKLQLQDTDQDPQKMVKLSAFRAELESKRIVKYWDTVDELVSQIKDSLNNIVRRKPAIGWIRGDQGFDPAVYKELEALRKENESLKKRLNSYSDEITFPQNISHGSDQVIIDFIIYETDPRTSNKTNIINRKALWSWDEILIALTNCLYGNKNEQEMQDAIEQCIAMSNISADDDHTDMELSADDDDGADIAVDKYVGVKNDFIERVRFQFEALGLITSILKSDFNMKRTVYWEMTEKGRKYISGLNAVRRVPTQNNANG